MTDITATVIADFREYYPEFSDDTTWTETLLTRHLEDADEETGSGRWGGYLDGPPSLKSRGMFAYAAHRAVIGKAASDAVAAGGMPAAPAQVNSKSVGDESVGYAVSTPDARQADGYGDLKATVYGNEFLRLRRRAGMGAATTGQVQL